MKCIIISSMWILLLFSLYSYADDMSSEKYCFSSPNESERAKHKFSAIQVPSDTVTKDESCLVIQMRPHRRELIQRFILSSMPGASVAYSSDEIRREPCRLQVEKVKQKSAENLNGGLNALGVEVNKTETLSNTTETMQIETLKDFQLTVDQDEIKGTCKYISGDRYEIFLNVRKDPRPIVPVALPPGSIVVMNQAPPDQETMSLTTQIQLTRGEKINIGEVVKTLRDKNNSIDVKPDLKIETKDQNNSEKVFLSLH